MALILEHIGHSPVRRRAWSPLSQGLKRVALLLSWVSLATLPQRAAAEELDTDQDGIPDRIEVQTGTDPHQRDSDRDGVPDGVEDVDRDGVVGEDESDPRRYGMFPGSSPHIPEPMVFDLVRGLGAKRHELESNVLFLANARTGRVDWAPELEYAFADGFAFEVELPLLDRQLEAVKVAVQATLPSGAVHHFTHGLQSFGEVSLDSGETDAVLLYMFGHRFDRTWSYLAMGGAKATVTGGGVRQGQGLLNASLFASPSEVVTWGFETNTSVSLEGDWKLRLFPQIHLQVGKHARIQLAAGTDLSQGRVDPVLGTRLIMED